MGSRNSQRDRDDASWTTGSIKLGTTGLDLREPSVPGALTKLLNARFEDDRTIARRRGHTGRRVRDSANFPPLGNTYRVSGEWVYGHGARVSTENAASWDNAHHPFPNRAGATFNYDGSDIVWTGDRLLVTRAGDTALGSSSFWQRSTSTVPLKYGHPAYLPLQVDSTPPSAFRGEYLETALTPRYRLHAHTNAETSDTLTAWLIDRETGAVVDSSDVSDGLCDDIVDVVAMNSGGVPVVMWRDVISGHLYWNHWTGIEWAGASVFRSGVAAYDVVTTSGGFFIAWHESGTAKAGYLSGVDSQDTPFVFGTTLSGATGAGAIALDVAPLGHLGVLLETASALQMRIYSPSLTALTNWTTVEGATGYGGGISIRSRGLRNSAGSYQWVVHTSRSSTEGVKIREATPSGLSINFSTGTRYNSVLASKSFRVGDEVFCWLRAGNAGTHYLVGGAPAVQVCGYADREEAILRVTHGGNYGVPHVWPDPLEPVHSFVWARPFNTGQDYPRSGNVRVGDLNFLPDISAVKFGRSVYLSGSAVRNWDGVELGDAGFQDYPTIATATPSNGAGSLTATGRYYYRVYAVRYNARGERFQSAAVSFGPVELAGAEDTVALVINALPSTNHADVVFEVYRTEDLGTTFYLEGTVDNTLSAATVAFSSTMSDEDLREKLGDSHAAGVGQLSEIEEWGPLGCQMLAVSGDRLWGAGGQVPPGLVQFSKLKEDGEGAGFDTLAGFQTVDTEGRPVTLVLPLNDTTVVHQADRLFVVAGTGPDNYGRGAFSIPQIMLADGAVTMRGGCLNQLGQFYWGADGPRLLTTSFQVRNISAPIRALSETLDPSGVRASLSEHEVIWYTRTGTALLLNYLDGNLRWAKWTGLPVAGCSDECLAMVDGRLLYPDETVFSDDGQGYGFTFATGKLRGDDVISGHTLLRELGVNGAFKGPHRLRARVYYNGSPLWTDEWIWEPETETWLTTGDEVEDMTPAQVDAAFGSRDHSGAYGTHRRPSRIDCTHFMVEVSDIESDGDTYIPFELAVELGTVGGLGRMPVNTFSTTVGR